MGKYYATKSGVFFQIRQTRYKEQREAGRTPDNDLCANALSLEDLKETASRYFPDVDYSEFEKPGAELTPAAPASDKLDLSAIPDETRLTIGNALRAAAARWNEAAELATGTRIGQSFAEQAAETITIAEQFEAYEDDAN